MHLKQRFFIFTFLLLLLFSAAFVFYAKSIAIQINEKWATKFIAQQLNCDKRKALLPIMSEIALVQKLAHDKAIIAMALHENNESIRKKGIEVLQKYRLKFHSRSYFAAFVKTKHYYYNDAQNNYKDRELIDTLDEKNQNDKWFFETIKQPKDFVINIDRDVRIGVTNVWINYHIVYNSKVIGVVGTGFELKSFLKNFVDTAQESVYNIFVDENLAIQLERDSQLIDYASISKRKENHKTLAVFIKDKKELQKIKDIILELKESPKQNQIRTLWLHFDNKEYLVGISYIKELDWFNITAVDAVTLSAVSAEDIIPVFIILLVILFILVGLFFNFYIINPVNTIKQQIEDVEKNGYNTRISVLRGNDVIAQLSQQFEKLLYIVNQNSRELEKTVRERTDELKKKQQFLNTILDNVDAYIYIKDLNFRYTYVNRAMQKAIGDPLKKIIGHDISSVYDEETARLIKESDKETLIRGKRIVMEEEINKDGHETVYILVKKVPLYDKDGKIYALLGVATDITQRKRQEDIINNMAFYDSLTKLPNRRLLEDRLSLMLSKIKRDRSYGALMFVDIDDFKSINDTYGHKGGDMLLVEISKRLMKIVRDTDTIARLGGDEFIIAIENLQGSEEVARKEALEIANKILEIGQKKYSIALQQDDGTIKQIEFERTFSIGITLFHDVEDTVDSILQRADRAMYKVKNSTKNGINIL